MFEVGDNPNLRPDGTRLWKPRKGRTDPVGRMFELWTQEQVNANNPKKEIKIPKGVKVQRGSDLPLDAGDRAEDIHRGRK